MSDVEDEVIVSRNIEEEIKESYLRYSMSVIISRALPDARDGLKPSQRRILFAMRMLNLQPGSKHRKCAKIAGDTSGDYHPHGETVIYPTLVRMAQDWAMRYPLIDGQGNFGSIDGDPPAAMRYTEAKLTSAAVFLMEDLEKETVDFISNYDETKKEPVVFPSKFPNLLCNGSSGIAVGMATNIPPHNLKELIAATLLLLKDPTTTVDQIIEVMPAPDFPTGGVICGLRGIRDAYHTGRGKLILRGLIAVESADKGEKDRLVINEIPYNVNKSRLIEKIALLVTEKTITGISDIRDESDKDGMRIVIELKKGEIPDIIINQLYKYTDMQTTFGCNMLALDKGMPRVMSIKQFITVWIDHRIEVIRRRTRFELARAEARAHILEGYLKALENLDRIVHIVRTSDTKEKARDALIEQFALTEKQATAVLDLRLYQLTGLERGKIEEEYVTLQKKITDLRAILASELLVRKIIQEELEVIAKMTKSDRKTKLVGAESEVSIEDLIPDEQTIITVSSDDYIKRMPIATFKEQRRGGHGVIGVETKKEQDSLKNVYVSSTHDHLLIFTNLGRCYWLKTWQIPESSRRSKGKPLINLLEGLGEDSKERIAAILTTKTFEQDISVLLCTKNGIVKRTELSAFSSPRRKGVYAINLDTGDEIIAARLLKEDEQIMLFTKKGMAVRFEQSLVREIGRVARGVRGIRLGRDDQVVSCEIVRGNEVVFIVCAQGYGKRSKVSNFRQTQRGGVGVRSIVTSHRNGDVVAALQVQESDSVLIMSNSGQTLRMRMKDVRIMGRNTQGVRLVNLKLGDVVVAVQRIDHAEAE